MKNNIIKVISAIFVLSFLFQITQAQTATDSFNKTYEWTAQTEEHIVYVNIKPNADEISMQFSGAVSSGNLIVTAYDPDGNKECGFCLITDCELSCSTNDKKNSKTSNKVKFGKGSTYSVSTNSNSNSNSNSNGGSNQTSVTQTSEGYSYTTNSSQDDTGAKGNAHEVLSDPKPGLWKFVIEAVEATGQLEVDINQK